MDALWPPCLANQIAALLWLGLGCLKHIWLNWTYYDIGYSSLQLNVLTHFPCNTMHRNKPNITYLLPYNNTKAD